MKKFLVCLFVAVLVISTGFAIFFFVGNQEKITLSASTLYAKVGDEFSLNVNINNRKKGTSYSISSSNEEVVTYDEGKGTFTAVSGGVARINVKTSNAKYKNLFCDVLVGDGSIEAPFYIESAEQLALIGTNEVYTLDKNYKLMNNIDLSEVYYGYFRPMGNLAGRFDGNGFTIKNLYLNEELYVVNNESAENYVVADWSNVGLFNSVLATGAVYNLKIENAKIDGSYNNVGTICAFNYGVVERIEIVDVEINVEADYVGGIVAQNIASVVDGKLSIARVDRSSANVVIGNSETGINAVVGGVVAKNEGGMIIYVYSAGNVTLKDSAIFGGVAGINEYVELSSVCGGKIKDSYSIIRINKDLISNDAIVGAVIGKNIDKEISNEENANIVVGCYYNVSNAKGFDGVGEEYLVSQNGTTSEVEKGDAKYYVEGYSADGLRNQKLLYSREIGSETKMWDFSNVWIMDSNKNNGYPVIDYTKIAVDEDFTFNSNIEKVLTLTFEYNGATSGNGLDSKEVVAGEMFGTLPTPARTGYTFAGWYLESTFVNRIYSSSVVELTENAVVYAKWIENAPVQEEYVVTFVYNGATSNCSVSNKTVVDGDQYGTLPTPVKTGYTFAGWYLESTFVNRVYASSIVNLSANARLYAKWIENAPVIQNYTLTLKSNLPNNDYWNSETYKNANYSFNFGSTLTSNETANIGSLTVKGGSTISKSLQSNSNGVAVVKFVITSQGSSQTLTYTINYNAYQNYSFILNGVEYNSSSSMNATINSNCDLVAKYNYSGVSGKSSMGSTSNPVAINSVADWNNLVVILSNKEVVNNNVYSYKQMSDLTVNSLNKMNFVSKFYGNYNGNNKAINNEVASFAPFINVAGNISNLKVAYNAGVKSSDYVGGIAQCLAGGKIEGCVVSGTINAGKYVGGIVGYVSTSASILNSTNKANITVNSSTVEYVGGIVGLSYDLTISGALNQGNINVSSTANNVRVGGLLGYASNLNLRGSSSQGNITVNASGASSRAYVGGLVGIAYDNLDLQGSSSAYCYNAGDINVSGNISSYVGGIVGATANATLAVIKYADNRASISSTQTKNQTSAGGYAIAGGIVGFSENTKTQISYVGNFIDCDQIPCSNANCVCKESISANAQYNNAYASNILALSNDIDQLKITNAIYNGQIYVNKDLNAKSMYAGGVVACFDGSAYVQLENLSTPMNKMDIKVSKNVASDSRFIGAIAGLIKTTNASTSSTINNCVVNTTLIIDQQSGGAKNITYIGGFVGCVIAESSAPFIIKGNSKNILGIYAYACSGDIAVGSVVGYAKNINISSTVENTVHDDRSYRLYVGGNGVAYAGGVIGACAGNVTINNSNKTSKVRVIGDIRVMYNGTSFVGGLVGYVKDATLNIYKCAGSSALYTGNFEVSPISTVYKNELYGARSSSSVVNVY